MSWKGTIEGNIPVKGLTQWREDSTLSYKQTIEGLNVPLKTRPTGSFTSRQMDPSGLLEMTLNPSFADTIINVGGKLFALTLETVTGNLLAPDLYSLSVNFGKALKTFFSTESSDIDIHDRWEYLIMEDFDTDGVWVASMSGTWNSEGYGRQVQDIPWEKKSGTWGVNATYGLIGPSSPDPTSLECQAAGYVYAGWDWWENYEFSIRFRTDLSTDRVGIRFRTDDEQDNYYLWYWNTTTNLSLRKSVKGASSTIGDAAVTITEDVWNHIKVICQGHRLRGYLNDVKIFDLVDESISSGKIGLYSSADNVYFDDLHVTLLPPESFNMPACADNIDQYVHKSINTAYGTQKKLIAPEDNIGFDVTQGEDCILHLPMNEGEGTPKDHSKNDNTVTLTGGTWVKDREKGWVLEWNGTVTHQVYVDLPNNSPTRYTVDFEVRADSFEYMYAVHFEAFQPLWYIGGTPTSWSWYYDNNAALRIAPADMDIDKWYRITFLADSVGDWAECFVDGKLIGRIARSGVDTLGDDYVAIGSNLTGGTQPWKGAIREFRIFDTLRWDVALGIDKTPTTVFAWDDNGIIDDSDCILLLHMDEGSGTTIYDASGNGHDSIGGIFPDWLSNSFRGEAGTCLDFDSVSNHGISFGDHDDFSFNGDVAFSLEAWIFWSADVGQSVIISKYGGNREWLLFVDTDDKIYFKLFNYDSDSDRIEVVSNVINVGESYHVVATYDGSKSEDGLNIYLNGVLDVSARTAIGSYTGMTNTTTALWVGEIASPSGAIPWEGRLDEIRIHRAELSAVEVASRFRSEPYLHDWESMTRAYHKSHPFVGLPVITNGLILLSFPDYNIYEQRTADVLLPTIYGWYENSWHLLGCISPYVKVNNVAKKVASFADLSEWSIEELTDQHCKLRISYRVVDSAWPDENVVTFYFIIKNGYPGVIIEADPADYQVDEVLGFQLWTCYGCGTGLSNRFWFAPEDNIKDALVDSAFGLASSAVDDNWAILFPSSEDSEAPSKNVIIGLFTDSIYDDLGTGNQWNVSESLNSWWETFVRQTKVGGIFFLPYDIDLLHKDGYDLTGTGGSRGDFPTGRTDDGTYELNSSSEYGTWDPTGTPEIAEGTYCAVFRVYNQYGGSGQNILKYAITDGLGGDVVSDTYTWPAATSSWITFYLIFHTDGTVDIDLKATAQTIASGGLYVDYMELIPLSNAIDYPSDLAHQPFKHTIPQRAWRIKEESAYEVGE